MLLTAIKSAAAGRLPNSDSNDVETLLEHLLVSSPSPTRTRPATARRSPVAAAASAIAAAELDSSARRINEDNQRLKAELAAARKLLTERLLS